MEFILLAIATASGLGFLTGVILRYYKLGRLRRRHIQKPEYDIEDDLTAAEFGCIIDGKVGPQEIMGQLVQLHIKGIIKIERDPSSARVIATKTTNTAPNLSESETILLKEIFHGPLRPVVLRNVVFTMQSTIEHAVLTSLRKKGWMKPTSPRLTAVSELEPRQLVRAAASIIAMLAVLNIASTLFSVGGLAIYLLNLLLLQLLCVVGVVGGLVVVARDALFKQTKMITNTSQLYEEHWHKVNGLHDYLRVSGMDIFTLDYEKLELHKIDKLYPYAVAAGLDKRLLRSL